MIMSALILISALALILLPVIPFDQSIAVGCQRSRLPCPMYPAYFYWSATAYFLGNGAYLAPYGYGFMGTPAVFYALIMTLLVPVFGLLSSLKKQTGRSTVEVV